MLLKIYLYFRNTLILVPSYKNVTSKQIFMKVHGVANLREYDALHYILQSRGVAVYDLITLSRQVTVYPVRNFAIISYLMLPLEQKNCERLYSIYNETISYSVDNIYFKNDLLDLSLQRSVLFEIKVFFYSFRSLFNLG